MATESTKGKSVKIATFTRGFTDEGTNIPVPAGATLRVIDERGDKVECETGECPVEAPRDAVRIELS
jgi:hypothetical protein